MPIKFASGAYLERANNTVFNASVGSVGVWVRRSGDPGGFPGILARNSSNTADGLIMFLNGGKMGIDLKSGTTSRVAGALYSGATNAYDGNWHLFSINYNQASGATVSVFTDGVTKGSTTTSGTWGFNSQVVRISRVLDSFWGNFDGSLAHAFWYNEILSDSEHLALAHGVSPLQIRPHALLIYLPMLDPVQTDDLGPNMFSMTVSGALTLGTPTMPIEPAVYPMPEWAAETAPAGGFFARYYYDMGRMNV